MKSIVFVLLLIGLLVAADHYSLLKTNPRYPEPINQLITQLNHQPATTLPETTKNTESPQITTLYQWHTNGGLVISDQPPASGTFETIILGEKITAQSSDQELLRQSQCQYFVEKIQHYKKQSRFGGPGDRISHWQRQTKWFQLQYFKNHCSEMSSVGTQ